MTGVEGIPDDVLARAVEVAAKAMCADEVASEYSSAEWDDPYCDRDWYLRNARTAVTAALGVVEASIKAQALREGADWLDREARAAGILEPDIEGLDAFMLRSRADLVEVGEFE